jgi:hypothetical protein
MFCPELINTLFLFSATFTDVSASISAGSTETTVSERTDTEVTETMMSGVTYSTVPLSTVTAGSGESTGKTIWFLMWQTNLF